MPLSTKAAVTGPRPAMNGRATSGGAVAAYNAEALRIPRDSACANGVSCPDGAIRPPGYSGGAI